GESAAHLLRPASAPHCEVRTSTDQDSQGALLLVDDQVVGPTDFKEPPLRVSPGPHTYQLQRQGQRGKPLPVFCPADGRADLDLSLSPDRSQGAAVWDLVLLVDTELEPELAATLRAALREKLERANLLLVSTARVAEAALRAAT